MFEELIVRITGALDKYRIPYMIIGGQAVLFYGSPRLTRDIDITLGISINRVSEVIEVLKDIGLKIIPENFEDFVKKTFVLPARDEGTQIRVDFIFSFTPYETQAIKKAKKVTVSGEEVFFASPEDVIIHKIFAGRPRDLEDVRVIILKNPAIDIQYIKEWLKEFDKSSEGEGFLRTFEEILGS